MKEGQIKPPRKKLLSKSLALFGLNGSSEVQSQGW